MAKSKKEETEKLDVKGPVFANGAYFQVIQLERDLFPKPTARRIIQLVNRDGVFECYISENAYVRAECKEILQSIMRLSESNSLDRGAPYMHPVKGRYHWRKFTVEFALDQNSGERVNPETGEPEAP